MALLHVFPLFTGNVTATGSDTVLYTVPAGMRVVVRSVAVDNLSGTVSVTWHVKVDGVFVHTSTLTASGAGKSEEWRPWLVLGPGQQLEGRVTVSSGVGCIASGSIYTI